MLFLIQEVQSNLQHGESPYTILGVKRTASKKEIIKAYHQFIFQHHPDRSKRPEDEIEMARANDAYEILMDSNLRSQLDEKGCYVDPYYDGRSSRFSRSSGFAYSSGFGRSSGYSRSSGFDGYSTGFGSSSYQSYKPSTGFDDFSSGSYSYSNSYEYQKSTDRSKLNGYLVSFSILAAIGIWIIISILVNLISFYSD